MEDAQEVKTLQQGLFGAFLVVIPQSSFVAFFQQHTLTLDDLTLINSQFQLALALAQVAPLPDPTGYFGETAGAWVLLVLLPGLGHRHWNLRGQGDRGGQWLTL